ncbi:hypothetical protein AOLI_G00137060 [Acnodon oligacanthus]
MLSTAGTDTQTTNKDFSLSAVLRFTEPTPDSVLKLHGLNLYRAGRSTEPLGKKVVESAFTSTKAGVQIAVSLSLEQLCCTLWLLCLRPTLILTAEETGMRYAGSPAQIELDCASSSLQCCCFELWAEAGSRQTWVVEFLSPVL